MRSVILHLRGTAEADVAAHLRSKYVSNGPEGWMLAVGGDPCLYIGVYRDGPIENEPADWARVTAWADGSLVSVIADVSGRHPGRPEAMAFIEDLLGRFDGVARDDYTSHLWTLGQLRAGHRAEGHPFFDNAGWYAERERRAAGGDLGGNLTGASA